MGNHKDVYKSSDSEYYAGFHWPIGHVTCTLDDGKSVQDPSGKNQMMWAMETPITTGPNPLLTMTILTIVWFNKPRKRPKFHLYSRPVK